VTINFSDILRLKKDIIFESNVLGWLDCGTSCLEKRACVAFNFKEKSKENEINCQLTQTADHNFETVNTHDNGWTFYETVGERMVRIFHITPILITTISDRTDVQQFLDPLLNFWPGSELFGYNR
jgi:hypothetical protein